MTKYRVGIDVGGTFTDAVAVNYETFELVGQVKYLLPMIRTMVLVKE